MKKSVSKKDLWIILGIVLAIAVAFIVTFSLLISCDNNGNKDDNIKKTVSVDEIPSDWEYFAPTLKLNKKDDKESAWSMIGFVQVSFHIEVGSQKIKPMLEYTDDLGETKIIEYTRDDNILAVVDYLYTPQWDYHIESMDCDTYSSTGVIYSTQSLRDITSESFNIVVEKISVIYVLGTKETSVNYTGSQISEIFDFEISPTGY